MGMGYSFEFVGGKTITDATGIILSGVQMRNEAPGHVWPIEDRNVNDMLVAIRIPSGKVWSGVGRPFSHVPAEIKVIRVDPKRKEANPVLNIDIGRKKA